MDFNELIGKPFTHFSIRRDLLKFFIKKLDGVLPVNNLGNIGEEKYQRILEVLP